MDEVKLDVQAGEDCVAPALYYFGGKFKTHPPEPIGTIMPFTELNGWRIGDETKEGRIEYFYRVPDDKRNRVMYHTAPDQGSSWNFLHALQPK